VGKSRLAEALAQRLAEEPHAHLLCQCSPQHTGSALFTATEEFCHVSRRFTGAGTAELEADRAHAPEPSG
jgi:hypothetical protein